MRSDQLECLQRFLGDAPPGFSTPIAGHVNRLEFTASDPSENGVLTDAVAIAEVTDGVGTGHQVRPCVLALRFSTMARRSALAL
jgi:hypothetical protein